METLRKLLAHPEFTMVLFLFCTVLFGWPFISITGPSSPQSMFVYLFFVWGAVIMLLYFISKSHDQKDSSSTNGEKRAE